MCYSTRCSQSSVAANTSESMVLVLLRDIQWPAGTTHRRSQLGAFGRTSKTVNWLWDNSTCCRIEISYGRYPSLKILLVLLRYRDLFENLHGRAILQVALTNTIPDHCRNELRDSVYKASVNTSKSLPHYCTQSRCANQYLNNRSETFNDVAARLHLQSRCLSML